MNERPVRFGSQNGLIGVLTSPPEPLDGRPGVILLNAGLLYRVGPNRLYVNIARRLAGMGYPCLRFDMSGVGDSELQEGDLLYIERSTQDTRLAMDYLHETVGTDRFVLMGLCTGAFSAFRSALVDERVSGCVLLDGYAYPTFRSRLRHYLPRAFELKRWTGYLGRRFGLAPASGVGSDDRDAMIVFENEIVPRDRFGRELGTLLERGTDLFMVYTGLGPLAFNYEGQIHDAFPELDLHGRASIRYYPDADHTFTLPGNRLRLIADVEDWMRTTHPVPSTPTIDGLPRERTRR